MAKQCVCTMCGYVGLPKRTAKGSTIIELFSSKRSQSTGYLAAKGFVNQPFVKNSKGKQLPAIWKTKDKKGYLEIKL